MPPLCTAWRRPRPPVPMVSPFLALLLLSVLVGGPLAGVVAVAAGTDCQVVVVGGATAGMSAALAAAADNVSTCLLEPTGWVGGQLATHGVPAVDFSPEGYPTQFGQTLDTQHANVSPLFRVVLEGMAKANYRTCWVSPFCYLPDHLVADVLKPMLRAHAPHLRVYYNTVVKNITRVGGRITAVTAITRTARNASACPWAPGMERRVSQQLRDWYSPSESAHYSKEVRTFHAPEVVIDGSYWGEALALSGGAFLQGCDERFDGDTSGLGDDALGQSATFTFHTHMAAGPTAWAGSPYPKDPGWHYDAFAPSPAIHTPDNRLTWDMLWSRRRSFNAAPDGPQPGPGPAPAGIGAHAPRSVGMHPPPHNNATPGDVSLMAWSDYYFGYIHKTKASVARDVREGTWAAGVNLTVLDAAERYSFAAFDFYRNASPPLFRNRTTLNSSRFGTCNGLAPLPYVRDSRRSLGLDGFLLNLSSLAPRQGHPTALAPADRVAIALHGCDIWGHRMKPFEDLYPAYMRRSYPVAPAYIPFRALTNANVSNLLVTGVSMAQSFMVNSAIRMHPIEWASGAAAGAAAAFMANSGLQTTREALAPAHLAGLLNATRRHTQNSWTIDGKVYPPEEDSV